MTYNTVIFDLDGTLLNTLEDLKDSVNHALKELNYPLKTAEEVRSYIGNGVWQLIQLSVPAGTSADASDQCLQLFKEHYARNNRNKTAPYEGIMELLEDLKKQGIKLAVVSNKFDAAVKALCPVYFPGYIDIAIGESARVARKPAPDSVNAVMEALGSAKEQVIYVGDSEVDVETAHNAGIPCIGVAWGFRGRKVLEDAGADIIIEKPQEIADYLIKI